MRHPIVGAETRMLQFQGRSRVYGPIDAEYEVAAYKIRKVPASSLVRIVTESGHALSCSPETVFGLFTSARNPVIYNPMHAIGLVELIEPNWGAPVEDFLLDWRSWFIRGRVLASGTYSNTGSRPARIFFPPDDQTFDLVRSYLIAARDEHHFVDRLGEPYAIFSGVAGPNRILVSRLIDWLCEGFLTPVDMLFSVEHCLSGLDKIAAHGFASGLLAGSAGGKFLHRSSEVVREVTDFLFYRYGLTGDLRINPIEPDFRMHKRGVKDPHHLDLHAPDLFQLAHERTRDMRRLTHPAIVDIYAVPSEWAYELIPLRARTTFFAVEGFLVEASFEADHAIDVAADLSHLGETRWVNQDRLLDPIYEG